MTQINNLTVLGSGVLGGQIAFHSAFKGKNVIVCDISYEALKRCQAAHEHYAKLYPEEAGATAEQLEAAKARLTYTTDVALAYQNCDLVIEAVPEIPEIKHTAYQAMADNLPDHAIIATNSSTFLPKDFAKETGRPDRFCALHFANLVWKLNLTEIMAHKGTSEKTLEAVTTFAIEIGMVPVPVQKEQNGYILNTWLVNLVNSAQTLITRGVSTPEDIDRTYIIANEGAKVGPCGLMDIVGMKTYYDILSYWANENNDLTMYRNAQYLKENFIDKNILGLQTNQGYYSYPNPKYLEDDFIRVPDLSEVKHIVARAMLPQDDDE